MKKGFLRKGISLILSVLSLALISCGPKDKEEKKVPISHIEVSSERGINVEVDGTVQLLAKISPEKASDKTLTWISSDESIASVDENGLVTGHALSRVLVGDEGGEEIFQDDGVVITAMANDGSGKEASFTVYVIEDLILSERVLLSGKTATFIGKEIPLTASFIPEDTTDKFITWTSSDEKIATVDENGLVTALSVTSEEKPLVITATPRDGGEIATFQIQITESPIPVESVTLSSAKAKGFFGESIQILPVFIPSNASNQTVNYSVNDESLATIDENGILKLNSENLTGTVTVNITTIFNEDLGDDAETWTEKTASIDIEILRPVSEIEIYSDDYDEEFGIAIEEEVIFKANVSPNDASDLSVEWTTSDETIATVDETGLVKGISEGEVKIIATAKDGSGVSSEFNAVVYIPVESIELLAENTNHIALTESSVSVNIIPNNATYQDIEFVLSDGSLTSFENLVLSFGDASENFTLTASSKQGNKTSSLDFTVSVDYSELETLIESADSKLLEIGDNPEYVQDLTDIGKYFEDSVTDLKTANQNAKDTLSVNSQSQVNEKSLILAEKLLQCKPLSLMSAKSVSVNAKSVIYSSDPLVACAPENNKSNNWGANGWWFGLYTNVAPNGVEDGTILSTVTTDDGRKVKFFNLTENASITYSDITNMNSANGFYTKAHVSLLSTKAVRMGFMKYGDDAVGPYVFEIDPVNKKVLFKNETGEFITEVASSFERDENLWWNVSFDFTSVYRESMLASGGPLVNLVFEPVSEKDIFYLDNVYFFEEEYSVEYFYSSLLDLISSAEKLSNNAVTGTEIGNYSEEKKLALDEVISNAQSMKDSDDKEVLKDLIADLEAAMKALSDSVIMPQLVKTTDITWDFFVNNTNLASGQNYSATSGTFDLAFDLDENSRWESAQSDNQSAIIECAEAVSFNKIAFKWEGAFTSLYEILISDDGENWVKIAKVETNSYETFQLLSFDIAITAKYIKFDGQKRGTPWGHSFYEMGLYYLGE